MSEYRLHGFPVLGRVVDLATWAKAAGLDGLLPADSELVTDGGAPPETA